METGRASRFPNCLKFRKAEARETLIKSLAFALMIQVNISRYTTFPSRSGNAIKLSGKMFLAPPMSIFYKERYPKVVFKSWVTSHNNDTSRPLEKGRAEGAG